MEKERQLMVALATILSKEELNKLFEMSKDIIDYYGSLCAQQEHGGDTKTIIKKYNEFRRDFRGTLRSIVAKFK